jgi:hypothetical protein
MSAASEQHVQAVAEEAKCARKRARRALEKSKGNLENAIEIAKQEVSARAAIPAPPAAASAPPANEAAILLSTPSIGVDQPLVLPDQIGRIEVAYIRRLYWLCMAVQMRFDFMLTGTCEVPSYVRSFPGGLGDLAALANALSAVDEFKDVAESLETISIQRGDRAVIRKRVSDEVVERRGREIGHTEITSLYDCLMKVQRCIEAAAAADAGEVDSTAEYATLRTRLLNHDWSHFRIRLRDYLIEQEREKYAMLLYKHTESVHGVSRP